MARPIDQIAQTLRAALLGALKDAKDELTQIAEAGGNKASGGLLQDVTNISHIISNLLPAAGELAGFAFPPLGLLEEAEKAGGKYGIAMGIGYWLGGAMEQAMQPVFEPVNHAIADAAQTEIFDPQTAAELQSRGIITDAYGRSEAAGGNLDGQHYDQLVDAALKRPDMLQLFDLWNRGYIAETDVNLALERNQIPEWWWDRLKQLRWQLLSPADLALANLRGEMTDADLQAYASRVGATPEDMKILIANTGEPPAAEQMMEAYRRGFVDQPTFDKAIRQSRIRDEWIPTMLQLRYSPMSTSDAIRAVIENYLTDDEGKAIAEQNGLIPEHWEPMKESWGRPLSHEQMLELYHRGQVTIDDVKQALRESDLKDKYIQPAIDLGRTLVPQRTIIMMLQHGVITHARAHSMLTEQGYTDDDAEAFIALGAAEHVSGAKQLSRTDIVTMYVDSLLTRAQATDHLKSLGYHDDDITALLDLATVKANAAQLKAIQRGVESSLKAHHLTANQAIAQLDAAGMDHSQAQGLVDLWSQERGHAVRELTEAQILSLGEHGLISPEDALGRLVGYGLAEADAKLLLILHGVMK